MSKRLASIAFVTATAVLWVGPLASAGAYTIYTDRAAWEGAVNAIAGSVITTDTFSNDIASAQTITLDSGIVSTNSAPPTLPNSFNNNSVALGQYNNATGGSTASATITWVFPDAIVGFGADFLSVNLDRLTLSGNFDGLGDQSLLVNNTLGGANGFLGVIGDADFNAIVFSSANGVLDGFEMDNASFATVPAATIPEPTTLALLGLGAIGLAVRRRVA